MRTLRSFLVVLVLVLAAAACGDDDTGVSSGDDDPGTDQPPALDGRVFLSTSVTENGQPRPLVDGTEIRLRFDDGNVGASAGCNSMGGAYELDGTTLVVTEMAMTEMGCDGPRHDQDTFVATVLGDRPTVALHGDTLTLSTATVTIELLDRVVADPDLDIVGPTWTVTGFIDGEAATSFAVAGEPAFVRFPDVSTVEWFDGCNNGGGPAEVSDGSTGGPVDGDGEIQWGEQVNEDEFCEDMVEYTKAFSALFLGPSVTYEIEADHLTIRNDRGQGVTFRAGGA